MAQRPSQKRHLGWRTLWGLVFQRVRVLHLSSLKSFHSSFESLLNNIWKFGQIWGQTGSSPMFFPSGKRQKYQKTSVRPRVSEFNFSASAVRKSSCRRSIDTSRRAGVSGFIMLGVYTTRSKSPPPISSHIPVPGFPQWVGSLLPMCLGIR